jgi:hypothetical protein
MMVGAEKQIAATCRQPPKSQLWEDRQLVSQVQEWR